MTFELLPRPTTYPRHRWLRLLPFLVVLGASAEDNIPQIIKDAPILETLEVNMGDHTVTYHRIETPALKPEVTPAPVTEPVPVVLSAAEQAEQARLAALQQVSLQISATVRPGLGSELQISTPSGTLSALSSADFRHLGSICVFEWDGMMCETIVFADTTDEPVAPGSPPFPQAVDGQSRCVVLGNPVGADFATAIDALGALHEYYDANRLNLTADFAAAEAARAAAEAEARNQPPPSKDTVIYYFPITSTPEAQP